MAKKKCPQRANRKGKLDLKKLEDDKRSRYTADERKRTALDYVITGNVNETARNMGIPRNTITNWRKQDWWIELLADYRGQYEDQLVAKLNKAVGLSLDKTIERLEKGNVVLDKSGKQQFIPVSARDSAVIAGVTYDKRRISYNLPTSIQGTSSTKQLEDLADQFKKLAQGFEYKKIRQETSIESTCEAVIDGEAV